MAQRFPHLPLLVFFCLCSSAIIAHQDEDPTTKTMEDFSGYPIHEPHNFIQNFVSSLSVDTQSLQKQVLNPTLLMGLIHLLQSLAFLGFYLRGF
jgi:hypothetical protein